MSTRLLPFITLFITVVIAGAAAGQPCGLATSAVIEAAGVCPSGLRSITWPAVVITSAAHAETRLANVRR